MCAVACTCCRRPGRQCAVMFPRPPDEFSHRVGQAAHRPPRRRRRPWTRRGNDMAQTLRHSSSLHHYYYHYYTIARYHASCIRGQRVSAWAKPHTRGNAEASIQTAGGSWSAGADNAGGRPSPGADAAGPAAPADWRPPAHAASLAGHLRQGTPASISISVRFSARNNRWRPPCSPGRARLKP